MERIEFADRVEQAEEHCARHVAGILFHLVLRYLLHSPPIAWQVPLIVVLIIGGIPLLVPLAQKLFAREFGSDHLAGISIITSVILGEYLVAAIVILMLSGGTALEEFASRRASSVLDCARQTDATSRPSKMCKQSV